MTTGNTGTERGAHHPDGRPFAGDLPRLPFERNDVLDIAMDNRRVRNSDGVTRVLTRAGDPAWLVTSYSAARQLFGDDRLGRSHPEPERASRISTSVIFGGPHGDHATERETHQRLRKLLVPAFSARRMARLGGYIEGVVSELLTEMSAMKPPADIQAALSFPLPVMVICRVLGVPYSRDAEFLTWAEEYDNLADPRSSAAAYRRLTGYLEKLIDEKRRAPDDGLMSRMVNGEASGWGDDKLAAISANVMFGGYQTTVARISHGILLLLANPEQRAALQADPSRAESAAEEIIRMSTPSNHGFPRYAHADITVGSTVIRQGDAVLLFPDVANRDGEAFPDPDRFDISRRSENMHLGFGHGPHYCIGASLARLELQAVFGMLFQRFPGLRLAVPLEDLRLNTQRQVGGLVELPVTW